MATFFMQPGLRGALAEGRIDFRPISYFGIHRFLCDAATRIDTVVVQISPPDLSGRCSIGPSVEFMPSVLARAGRAFGVINPAVPRLQGSFSVPMEQFERVAWSHAPLATYDVGAPSPSAARVVDHLARLIPSSATLQVGLGKIPSQLLQALRHLRELRIHSGMISDSILELAASGALCGDAPIVTGVAAGTTSFLGELINLHGLSLAEVAHTHGPETLSRVPLFHAVNSALEVDLLGQANAEMLDGRYVSGPGGLPDFARAAHLDPEGLSIIALNATDGSGKRSRIVPRFAAGTPVTVPQHDIDVVVTEFGIARLRGEPLDIRIRRMCSIAHPDHRSALADAARALLR